MKKLPTKLIGAALLFITPLFLLVGVASAQAVRTGVNGTVPNDQTINSTLFISGSNVDIAGRVNGDVFCAGQNVTISGTVTGDVICGAQTITITGAVGGNVRLAGQNISLDGTIDRNATVVSQNFSLGTNGHVNDLMGAANTANINGTIGRDFGLTVQSAQVSGNVVRNINGTVQALTLTSTARVGGDITVTSPNDPTLNQGAKVSGTVTRNQPKQESVGSKYSVLPFVAFMWALLLFAALLITSLGLVMVAPGVFVAASKRAEANMGRTVLTGLIAGLVVPVAIVVLALTFVGIPLALFIGLVWLVVGFLSGPSAAFLLGRGVHRSSTNAILTMLIGASLLLALYFVPVVGFLAVIAAHLFGTGMVVQEIHVRLPKPSYKIATK